MPSIASNTRVKVFEVPLSDIIVLAECISPYSSVISCITTNYNTPGCSIALDTALSIVAALDRLQNQQQGSKTVLPQIIVLNSATIDPYLCRDIPRAIQ